MIIDELGFVPLSKTGAELLFEVFSQRYERGATLVTSNLPFDEWTEVFGSERLTGALLDRLTHHVHILEMNGDSYRLKQSQKRRKSQKVPDRHQPSRPWLTRWVHSLDVYVYPMGYRGNPQRRILRRAKWSSFTPPIGPIFLRR